MRFFCKVYAIECTRKKQLEVCAMKNFMKKYGFITLMLLGIVAGCIVGAVWKGATALEPFGTLFINPSPRRSRT